jgi:hypothetical protein
MKQAYIRGLCRNCRQIGLLWMTAFEAPFIVVPGVLNLGFIGDTGELIVIGNSPNGAHTDLFGIL